MTGTETNRAAAAPCKFFTPPAQSGKRRARTARRGQAASAARPSAPFPLDSHLSYTRRTRGGRGCQAGQDWPRSEKIPAPADPPARREFSHSLTASHLPSSHVCPKSSSLNRAPVRSKAPGHTHLWVGYPAAGGAPVAPSGNATGRRRGLSPCEYEGNSAHGATRPEGAAAEHRGNFGSGLVARAASRSCRTNTFRSRRKVREMCPSGTSARFTEWCTNSGSPFRFAISST